MTTANLGAGTGATIATTTATGLAGTDGPRARLAKAIPRRPRVTWWIGLALAAVFAIVVTPSITAERWLGAMGAGHVVAGKPAPMTVRVAPFAGFDGDLLRLGAGGIVVARGELVDRDRAAAVATIEASTPRGALPYATFAILAFVLGALFTVHTRRSVRGRLLRVQIVSLGAIALAAAAIKIALLATPVSVLAMPIAVLALVPTLVLDRVVGLATGVLAALVVALLVPFDVGVAIVLLVQVATVGLVVAERPKRRARSALGAGAVATLLTGITYPLLQYLITGHVPTAELADPLRSSWVAAALGPALATVIALPLLPLYELAVGEITHGRLIHLEDLGNPLLRQIADKAPGTWQHSLMMANLAEIAANAIGANGRLVRVGAYYHDLGKSLQPKYFIENLEPGETSPHDHLPPEVSCDAIFAHVTEGLVAARRAGLHERIVDFMHMHHGNGVLEYFWAKTREQGNPKGLTVENFRYPGVPPQSRETAILAICDAVEAASRTLKKPDVASIDSLVQRIVYGKLHLGQLDESGLSMSDLRQISDSLRETIKHANHGRIEYPWQKAQQDASAQQASEPLTSTGPRLDSLDRAMRADSGRVPTVGSGGSGPTPRASRSSSEDAFADTAHLRGPGASSHAIPAAKAAPTVSAAIDAQLDAEDRATAMPVEIPIDEPSIARTRSERRPVRGDSAAERGDNAAAMAVRDAVEAAARPPVVASTQVGFAVATAVVESSASALSASPSPAARKRAATLPPTPAPTRRLPTVPPPAGRRSPTLPPTLAARSAMLDGEGLPRAGSAAEGRRGVVDGEGLPRAGSAAEGRRGVVDGEGLPRAGSAAEGRRGVVDGEGLPRAGSAAEGRRGVVDGEGLPRAGSAAEGRRGVVDGEGLPRAGSAAEGRRGVVDGEGLPRAGSAAEGRRGVVDDDPASSRRITAERPIVTPPSEVAEALAAIKPATLSKLGRTTTQSVPIAKSGTGPIATGPIATAKPTTSPIPTTLVAAGIPDPAARAPIPTQPSASDAAITLPRMERASSRDLPLPAPASSNAALQLPSDAAEPEPTPVPTPARATPPPPPPAAPKPAESASWTAGLASRIDAALDADAFGAETPVVAPTSAELRALLGKPDATRQLSLDEIEAQHAAAHDSAHTDPAIELSPRRVAHGETREVDPDDIEAAIELAPPARRTGRVPISQISIGQAKTKKPLQ